MTTRVQLPDFDDMFSLAEQIADLTRRKLSLETDISFKQSEIVVRATTEEQFKQNGKTPSMEFIKSSFMQTGFDGELKELRSQLVDVTAELERKKQKMQIYRDLISVFQTQSANERASLLT